MNKKIERGMLAILFSCVPLIVTAAEMTTLGEVVAAVPVEVVGKELIAEQAALEVSAANGSMTHDYGDARAVTLHGVQVTSIGVVQEELARQSRFGFTGNYGNVLLTHEISDDYYGMVGAGTGSSPLFPKWRVDTIGYRKFGDARQYVAGLGGFYAQSNESGRSDRGMLLTAMVYFPGLVIESGLRLNWADPGSLLGPSEYLAVTLGSDDRRALIVRYEHARETYQVLLDGSQRVDFNSDIARVQWRERITRNGLLLAGLEYYRSPVYDRFSMDVGWRWSFR